MAGQKQGSARVTLREIDLSQVSSTSIEPQGVPAAIVGTSHKGPAFVPRTFANMQQFQEVFGSMTSRGRLKNSNLYAPLAFNEWMRNSQAGTFIRVLGVGDGSSAATGSGFVVGSEQVQLDPEDSANRSKVFKNRYATITDNLRTKATQIARTHMLGCFMTDSLGSTFLKDSGVQTASVPASATLSNTFEVSANPAVGDKVDIFVPKEMSSDLSEDVTITIELTADLNGTPAKNTIFILHGDQGQITGRLEDVFNLTTAKNTAANNGGNKVTDLPFVMNDVFNVSKNNNIVTITMVSTSLEGDFVKFTQTTGGTSLLGAVTKTLSGANPAVPIIRGLLMAPQGVKPTLNVSENATVKGNYVSYSEASTSNISKEVNTSVFGDTAGTNLVGYSVGDVDSNTFKVILNGFVNAEQSIAYTCSFDPQSDNYFAKVLNTDPTKIEELGHYLYAHWDIETAVAQVSNSGLSRGGNPIVGTDYANMTGFLISEPAGEATKYEKFEGRFGTAKTPWIVSQYNGGNDASNRGTEGVHKLFKLHILDDGNSGNSLYRVLISDLRYEKDDYGTFSLTLEEYSSDSILGTPVVTWKQLNLDPNSRNYIGRVIGDKYTYYDFSSQKLRTKGNFEVRNEYVRVELSDELKRNTVNIDALPTGFKGHGYLHTTSEFTEESANDSAQLVFSDGSNDKLDKLADIKVLPLPYVTSISKKVTDNVYEATNDLAWGVKLGIKKNVNEDTNPKEHIENEFNKSLLSWAKFYPSLVYKEDDNADTFQNSFFSLEKIKIPAAGISSDVITSWGQARYNRDGVYGTDGRFVSISKDAKGSNVKYLKFRCLFQGGWDGVNIFDKDKSELNGAAASRESRDEKGTSQVTGPTVMSYRKAIDVLSDKSAAEFQLLAIPGQRAFSVTNYAITACETRFDAMLVMDIEQKGANRFIEGVNDEELPHVGNTISEFAVRSLDSSFAAAYFPNVLIRRTSDSAPVEVPPSVAMIGVMSRNDTLEAPWAAPAGLTRGTLTNSIDSKVQMNRELLDDLYDNDINPIYVPAGRPGEVYAFGQKTLLQSASALDRINVRRLLIDIRRKVKKIGESLLFEPNRESTLERFSALVEPIMQDVQRRRGVVRYKVLIDTTTTTQNDIENNTIRGKIYLQPTKSVEFISLDFVVANTIQ